MNAEISETMRARYMNAEISETVKARLLGFGMQIPELLTQHNFGVQIPELLTQRKCVSAACHAYSNAYSKIGHAHLNAHKPPTSFKKS